MTQKEREAYAAAILGEISDRKAEKEVAAVIMAACGSDIMLACGCQFGTGRYTPCRAHASKSAPRVCFCGHNEELYDRTAQAYKPFTRNSEERAAPLQRERIAHFRECCRMPWQGTPEEPEAIEETVLAKEEERPVEAGKARLTAEESLRRIFQEPACV